MNRQFTIDAQLASQQYPSLVCIEDGDDIYLKGTLSIIDSTGKTWDSYQIEIHATKSYPETFPAVFETGNTFPKIKDWHVNEDLSCCFDTLEGQLIKCHSGMTLSSFIKAEVIPWFANTTHRRQAGHYLYGELGHGTIGIIEFFMDRLSAPNFLKCTEWLLDIYKQSLPGRTNDCFCGSGNKYRKCHKKIVKDLMIIPPGLLQYRLEEFIKLLKNKPLLIVLQQFTSVQLI